MAPDSAEVLARAVIRVAAALHISEDELAQAIDLDKQEIESLSLGRGKIPVDSDAGHRCQLLIRMYRALESLVGDDQEKSKLWFRSRNEAAGGIPAELVATPAGLREVVEYLETAIQR